MGNIKEAFQKIKKDIDSLYDNIGFLRTELIETRKEMIKICEVLKEISKKTPKQEKPSPTHLSLNQALPTYSSTHKLALEPLKPQNMALSTGNGGVPTDRQTDRQTDIQHKNLLKTEENSIENAARLLDSLDSIKKEIRLKFKRLTDQEILVFSTLYQLDEESEYVDYKTIALKLKLTESSIGDYIGRLIKKGIPVEKKKINNKTIHLSISNSLKKIASLPTILKLRDL